MKIFIIIALVCVVQAKPTNSDDNKDETSVISEPAEPAVEESNVEPIQLDPAIISIDPLPDIQEPQTSDENPQVEPQPDVFILPYPYPVIKVDEDEPKNLDIKEEPQETQDVEPETQVDPETPQVEPETPQETQDVEPETQVEPETPQVDPETPQVEPETAQVESEISKPKPYIFPYSILIARIKESINQILLKIQDENTPISLTPDQS